MTSNRDLREHMNSKDVADAFGFLVSGRKGYKTIIERKIELLKCSGCSAVLHGDEKFCSECGAKVALPAKK